MKIVTIQKTTIVARLLFLSLMIFIGCIQVNGQSVVFHQLNFDYNGTITNNSDWGAADLTFIGSTSILYFNLAVGPTWVIQNIPVLTTRGVGLSQTQRFWFPIGPSGIQVTLLNYGFTLTPAIAGQPVVSQLASVTPDQVTIYSGFTGGPPGGGGPGPADIQVGGEAVNPTPVKHDNFPNQECPWNFCVPAGVSNSLQWLNTKNSLGMNANKISIPALAGAFGTTTGNGTYKDVIYPNKKEYCKNNKLPITTHKANGSQIAQVVKEINNGQDVELLVEWTGEGGKGHCVAVTGATDLGDGKYSLLITHDKDQSVAGGTIDENATYNSNTKTWGGALSKASGASGDIEYIIECPAVRKKQPNNNLPGGVKYRFIPDASSIFDEEMVQIQDLELTGYNNVVPVPPLNNIAPVFFSGSASLKLSLDSGQTFIIHFAPFQAFFLFNHVLDSAGREYFQTEIVQLELSGGTLPPDFIYHNIQSPTTTSTGSMSTMPIAGGGFQIDSFFDVFTEITLDGGATWHPDMNESSVLNAEGVDVLETVQLQNMNIPSGAIECYDATQTISVAGNGETFTIEPNGCASLIAGQNILLKPGTTIHSGGYFYAWIAPTGPWCNTGSTPPVVLPEPQPAEKSGVSNPEFTQSGASFFRIYPNPTSGTFTIELTADDQPWINSVVTIYGIRGDKVLTKELQNERKHEFSLDGTPPGIYFIRITSDGLTETEKIIKY